MGICRFLYNNQISGAELIDLSSARPGLVGMPAPKAAGSATAYAAGQHTGALAQVFIIEIDSVAAGNSIGQATFRWRRADSLGWEASGQATSDSLITLADGVRIKWTAGVGDDFAAGDSWTLLASRNFGASALVDADRDSYWEATGCTDEHLTADLGEARAVQAMVLADHNLSAGATIILMGNSADSWAAPAYTQSLSAASPHLAVFIDQTYRYWRLRIQDAANPDGLIRAGSWYLGSYFEPSRNFSARHTQTTTAGRSVTSTDAGKLTGSTRSMAEGWALSFSGLSEADVSGFKNLHQNVHDPQTGRLAPLFFTPDSAAPAATYYCLPSSTLQRVSQHVGHYSLSMNLEEAVRTRG